MKLENKMQDKYITYQNCPNNSNQDSYQDTKIKLKNTYSEVIEEYYTEKHHQNQKYPQQ